MKKKKTHRFVYRSARTGRFVGKKYAEKFPGLTVKVKVRIPQEEEV